nr:hypothetical protein [Micromonospora sp. DSM 115978]
MDISAVRRGLADACATVVLPDGGRLATSHYIPDSVDPPVVYPAESTGTYNTSLDATTDATVTLRVLTSRAEDQAGQELLDALLSDEGPSSLIAAIHTDPTLGGECSDATVTGWSGYTLYDVAATEYYGAELTVEILG